MHDPLWQRAWMNGLAYITLVFQSISLGGKKGWSSNNQLTNQSKHIPGVVDINSLIRQVLVSTYWLVLHHPTTPAPPPY